MPKSVTTLPSTRHAFAKRWRKFIEKIYKPNSSTRFIAKITDNNVALVSTKPFFRHIEY